MDAVELPLLGHVPVPLVILVALVGASWLVARLTDVHAGLIGRRWAGRLADDVERRVTGELRTSALAGLDVVETSRRALWQMAEEVRRDCGGVAPQTPTG